MLSFEKADLVKFYNAIENEEAQIMFLAYCVTGLRRNDVFNLLKAEIDTEKRMIVKNNSSRTKLKWVTFYNEELAELLHPHLKTLNGNNRRVFSLKEWKWKLYWDRAKAKTGLDIKRKDLRDFFCIEMTELGVPDRYIDAFCGRVPKSVLARHYTDYSPKKLKKIYDKAGLRILS